MLFGKLDVAAKIEFSAGIKTPLTDIAEIVSVREVLPVILGGEGISRNSQTDNEKEASQSPDRRTKPDHVSPSSGVRAPLFPGCICHGFASWYRLAISS